jgi:hypothetical protein
VGAGPALSAAAESRLAAGEATAGDAWLAVAADTQTGSVPAWPVRGRVTAAGPAAAPRDSADAVLAGVVPGRRAVALPAAGQADAVSGRYCRGATPAGSCAVSWWWPLASGCPVTDFAAGTGNGDQTFTRCAADAAGATAAASPTVRKMVASTAAHALDLRQNRAAERARIFRMKASQARVFGKGRGLTRRGPLGHQNRKARWRSTGNPLAPPAIDRFC